jgi:hypothetical protein
MFWYLPGMEAGGEKKKLLRYAGANEIRMFRRAVSAQMQCSLFGDHHHQ